MSKKKKWFIWLIIIAAIIGGIVYWRKRPKPTQFTTQAVQRGTVAQTVSATGELKPKNQIEISAKLSGRIETLAVSVGDAVKKDQLIARIDRGTLNESLRQAEADIIVQKRTLYDMNRNKDTFSKDDREAQKAVVLKFEAAKDQVLRQIKETNINAPIDGVVIKKNLEQGETAAANSVIVTIANLNELEIESNIPESDIVNVKTGQTAEVAFDSMGTDEKFEAEIVRIEPAATVIQDVVFYKVKLELKNFDNRLKAGMSNDMDIRIAEKNNVLNIPERAVRREGIKRFVKLFLADKTTRDVEIQTGLRGDDGNIEITSGLKEGDNVVVAEK